jgi:putative cell wall-binding protein
MPRPIRSSLVGLLALLLLAPAAGAATSAADRLVAAGAGQAFTAPVGPTSFADTGCFTDPTGDVIDDDEDAIDEPRADIVEHCASFGGSTLTLSVTTAEPVDPEEDENYAGSAIVWLIDTDGDDEADFAVTLAQEDDGTVTAEVQDRSTTPATTVDCDATYDGFDGAAITVTVDADCLESPDAVGVAPGIIYDQRVSDPSGEATLDFAPNDGTFEDPVDAGLLDTGVTRIFGETRIETAIEISRAAYGDGGSDTVLLARSDLFPDALAGVPLAVELDAPILLTEPDALSPQTAEEIDRVTGGDGTVVILGGEVAVSADVEQALVDAGYDTVRYGGENRFETAVEIATEGLDSPSNAFVADGGSFQDPLVAGPAAAVNDGAVLLTDGDTVPAETQAYLDGTTGTVFAIGPEAVAALPDAEPVAGEDPVQTSVLVAETFFPDVATVGVARVDEFADALTGGALIANPAAGPGPMLFVEPDHLPDVVEAYLVENPVDTVVIFGGPVAVSEDVEADIEAAIAAEGEDDGPEEL